MEVLKSEYLVKVVIGDLKEKPSIDIEDLENEILSFLEDKYQYKVEVEVEVQDDKPKGAF